MKTHRLARVAEVIREVAATTVLFEMRDPRVKNVTVTRAEVSADLQHAKVYVSIMGSERDQKQGLYGLQNAAGFVQSKLAKRLMTRFLPVIQFVLDEGVKKSLEIAKILAEEKRLEQGDAIDEVELHNEEEDSDDDDDSAENDLDEDEAIDRKDDSSKPTDS